MRPPHKDVLEGRGYPRDRSKSSSAPWRYSLPAWLLLLAVMSVTGCESQHNVTEQKSQHSVTLTWKASPSLVAGYAIYRQPLPGGHYSRLVSKPVPGTQYQDTSVRAGQTYSYYVTAVSPTNVESKGSEAITVTVPSP
jgi:fibronectin type 3 domain-containing protein